MGYSGFGLRRHSFAFLLGYGFKDGVGSLLNPVQRLCECLLGAAVKLDVVASCGAGVKADGVADDERHGLGFGFLPGLGAANGSLSLVEHLVCQFVNEYLEGLAGRE